MRLGDIATIRTGLVLGRKKADAGNGIKETYKLLTLKNISDHGEIDNSSYEMFKSNEILDERYFTKEGNILIRLNHPYTAVYINKEHVGLLIPSYFVIIEVTDSNYLPEYISWYLNTERIKHDLERAHAGSRIPTTNQNTLKQLSIGIINLSKQKALIELYKLHRQEKQLYEQLIQEKDTLFKGLLNKFYKINQGGKSNDKPSNTRPN